MPFTRFRPILLVLLVLVAAVIPGAVLAQGVGHSGTGIVADQRRIIEELSRKVDEQQRLIEANAEDDARLVEIRLTLDDFSHQTLASAVAFRPRLSEINSRIEQLGPPPTEGQPEEPDIVTAERSALAAEKAEINAVIGVAESLSIRVTGLIERIADIRRDLFQNLLTKRYDIGPSLAGEVWEAFKAENVDIYRAVSSWLRFATQFKLQAMVSATFFSLLAAVVILVGGRRLFGHVFEPDPTIEDPIYLARLSVAFWSTLIPTAALAVFLGSTYLLYENFGVLRGDIGAMMLSLFYVIATVYFVHRLATAALAPRLPTWRLIPVETRAAWSLVALVSATAIFTGLDYFLGEVYGIISSPLTLTVGESLVATVVTGILVVLVGLVKPFADESGRPKRWPTFLRLVLFLLGGLTIGAAVAGYVGLAKFVSQQIVITGAILATMYIGFLSARAMSEEGAYGQTKLGRRLGGWMNLDESGLDQLGLAVSILINVLIMVIGLPLILLQWGFQLGDIRAWLSQIAAGFTVGTFTISPTSIVSGIVIFVIGYFLTRWFQGWLDGSVMARGKVDTGVRNSIRLAVGYTGVAIAGLLGVSAAGINLSNLALVAGALSLGIGFGLQNVVSNFVSGLILLAERPFKVGDWIVAGAVSGTVKKISVRATEIETFQRQSVILPNSDLINSAVGNWTHRNRMGRVDIKVGVAYGQDAKRAHAIMLDIAKNHPMVLKNPEPFVLFANFGPAALEFEIRAFLADVMNGNSVQNDVRFAVMDAFEAAGIEIPSAPRAVTAAPVEKWSHDDERAEAELMERKAEEAAAEAAARAAKPRRRPRKPDPD